MKLALVLRIVNLLGSECIDKNLKKISKHFLVIIKVFELNYELNQI